MRRQAKLNNNIKSVKFVHTIEYDQSKAKEYFNKMYISTKMVSQVHTITNKSRLADGPVTGLPGYNPFLTVLR